MPGFLLVEQFLQSIHQLVVAEFFDLRFLFGRQLTLQPLHQPVQRYFRRLVEQGLRAVEVMAECLVELVKVRLILHQRGPGEVVELINRGADHLLVQRLEQNEKFLDRYRNLRILQREEEINQHDGAIPTGLAILPRHEH